MSKIDTSMLVRQQYEALPYPPRDPEAERKALLITEFDYLGIVSHYCFSGKLSLEKPLRVLVAGGGTGDATIFLAEQLRDYDAEIVYLDMSQASLQVAQQRAEVRGLTNISWVRDSILAQSPATLGHFDYISSSGVLHHLQDPAAGLKVLSDCLKEDGAFGIMVYGRYGRTSVYHAQELFRLIDGPDAPIDIRLQNARAVLNSLPATNWLKSGPEPLQNPDRLSDSDIFDLFLHAQDRAYTVPELHAWLADAGLHLVEFASNKHLYDPLTFLRDARLISQVGKMPKKQRQAIAEVMAGNLNKHVFYATRRAPAVATTDQEDHIPYLCDGVANPGLNAVLLAQVQKKRPGELVELAVPNLKFRVPLNMGICTPLFIQYMNGEASIKKIMKSVKRDLKNMGIKVEAATVAREWRSLYQSLNRFNVVLLRDPRCKRFKTYAELQRALSP